jgi:hypothetical protein
MSASTSLQPLTTSATPSSAQGRTECAFVLYDDSGFASLSPFGRQYQHAYPAEAKGED